jgi:hypothetical protein
MTSEFNKQMDIPIIPSEILSLAVNKFAPKNFYIRVGRNLNKIINDIDVNLIDLDPQTRSTASLLPFVTFFQFFEKLTDRTTIDAIQHRTDWKYALHLPIAPPIIRETILCEYRRFLLMENKRINEFQRLIYRLGTYLPEDMNQTINASQLLLGVCKINQKDIAVIVLNKALAILRFNHPKWLKKHDKLRLYARYLSATSQYDVLIPHDFSQFQIDEVLNDLDFLVKEVALFGSEEIKNLIEIIALSQIASQIRIIDAGKQTISGCDNFITILGNNEVY